MQIALDIVNELTPSVLSLAKVMKVEPKAIAEAIADNEAVSLYRTEVTAFLQPILVKKAIDEAKEANKTK